MNSEELVRVNLITVNYNESKDTISLIESILNQDCKTVVYKIFLVDNSESSEHVNHIHKILSKKIKTVTLTINNYLKKDFKTLNRELIIIKCEQNLGFARANNLAFVKAKLHTDYCLISNNDVIFPLDFSNKFFGKKIIKNNWCTTCVISIGKTNKYWYKIGKNSVEPYFRKRHINQNKIIKMENLAHKTDFASGAFFNLNMSFYNDEYIFNENFYFGEEDSEFCKRCTKKYGPIYSLQNVLVHHMIGQSRNKKSSYWRLQNAINSKLTLYRLYLNNPLSYFLLGSFYILSFWTFLYGFKYSKSLNKSETFNLFRFSIERFKWNFSNYGILKNQGNMFTLKLINENS